MTGRHLRTVPKADQKSLGPVRHQMGGTGMWNEWICLVQF